MCVLVLGEDINLVLCLFKLCFDKCGLGGLGGLCCGGLGGLGGYGGDRGGDCDSCLLCCDGFKLCGLCSF